MNILFYIPNITRESGGIFQYSFALLKILGKDLNQYNILIYALHPDDQLKEIVSQYDNLTLISQKEPLTGRLIRNLIKMVNLFCEKFRFKLRFRQKSQVDFILRKYKIKIIHSPYQTVINTRNTKSITTMHDVQELHFPEFFSSADRAYRAVIYKKAIDEADAVIVSYEHIKQDIIKFFAKDEEKVHVVLLNMGQLWFDNLLQKKIKSNQINNSFDRFLLYPAATWPHKNHLKLLEAIAYLRDQKGINVKLICTGNKTEHFTIIAKRIKELTLDDQVSFKGIVSEDELFSYYTHAQGVVIPTLYEAGSFPLMESLLIGAPVICSNVTSLPQTIGKPEFTFDPNKTEDIAIKIQQILVDKEFRKQNLANAKIQREKLRNANAAAKIDKIYRSLLSME